MGERYYRGTIRKHLPVSAQTGTPGIEFEVEINEVKQAGRDWESSVPMTRRVSVWFPASGDHSYSLKKLRHAGWRGGGLSEMDLTGNTAELISKDEEYQGRTVEKFDLAFPPRETQVSESAALTIDAILQSAPVDTSPAPVDTSPAPEKAAPAPAPAPAVDSPAAAADAAAINEIAERGEIPF